MMAHSHNLKMEMKAHYSNEQIIEKISKLGFMDSMIDDHLKQLNGSEEHHISPPKYAPRDPVKFQEYHKALEKVIDSYDPFTKFYMQEYVQENYSRVSMRKEYERRI